ncbi:MAG TPA: hypothetical protein VJ600_10995 [Holophagaceae bacterium]|nr:hypothetical protein [Holophagaceae bacterium]
MLRITAGLVLLGSICCKYPYTGTTTSSSGTLCETLPDEVKNYLHIISTDPYRRSISPVDQEKAVRFERNELDIYLIDKEHIASKQYGWKRFLPYHKRYLGESEDLIFLQTHHSFADGYSVWTSYANRDYVIDKKSGAIVAWRNEEKSFEIQYHLVVGPKLYLILDPIKPTVYALP